VTAPTWKPIDTAPHDEWVMVKSANGTKFLASFRMVDGVRAWCDVGFLLRNPVEWFDDSATRCKVKGA